MKRVLWLFVMLFAMTAIAQQNSTPNLQFALPPHGSSNWDAPLNTNFTLLDQYLSGQKTLPPSFWNNFLVGLTVDYSKIVNKPQYFPADWNSTVFNRPTAMLPTLPTTTQPGGVFMPAPCNQTPGAIQHVSGINPNNGQLICTPDQNSSFTLYVNGTAIVTGINGLNFACSSGLSCSGTYNAQTGQLTLTVTGSTATQAQSPTFSPLPGTYLSAQSVTLACTAPSPTIYYTTDGTTPTHSSTVYSTTISASNTTIKAICASSGLADSNVQTGVYTLTTPAVAIAPSSLTFSTQKQGTSSSSQGFTLTNTGSATLSFTSIVISGDYSQANNCGSSIAAGTYCTINVTFTPTTTGTRTGTLTVTDNASGSPHTASVSGTGALPLANPSPASLTFSSQNVGTTSTGQAVTISNGGAVALVVSSITITGTNSGDFSQSNTCGTVASGGTCTVNVFFSPSATGSRTATLNVNDDSAGSPQTVPLTGTGSVPPAPIASLSSSSLTFSSTKVGTAAGTQTSTLSNTGNASLAISSIAVSGGNSGDFSQSNNCGSSLNAGSNCIITVTFTPAAAGARSSSIAIADNAAGSPHSVAVSGTGVMAAASVSPTGLNYGNVPTGTTGTPQVVTLTNTSAVPMLISSIGVSGDYSQTNGCGGSLNPSASCNITVNFSPVTTGTRSGTLTITDDASGSPQTVSLTGFGTQPTAVLGTTSMSFTNTTCSTNPPAQTSSLTNTGNAPLTITNITLVNLSGANGGFSPTSNCGSTLAAGASCTITVNASGGGPPGYSGSVSGQVEVIDNAPNSPQIINVSESISCPNIGH